MAVHECTPKQAAALAFAWWIANPGRIEDANEPYRMALTEGAMLESVDRAQTNENPEFAEAAKRFWDYAVTELEALVNHDGPLKHYVSIAGRFK